MRRMLVTLMFSVVAMKSRTFSIVSHTALEQVCRAGREHSQADSPSWSVEIFHTIDLMLSYKWGLAEGAKILFLPPFLGV